MPSFRVAQVAGGNDGAPPCTSRREGGQYGASVDHPERAPLQTEVEFAHGVVRWALCGADVSMSSELLNLRSSDSGKTWSVADTGFGMSPHHLGDKLHIHLMTEDVGSVHVLIPVGPVDRVYSTDDGGRTWRLTCDAIVGPKPSPC